MTDLITTKEAAEILDVEPSTLRKWRERKLFGCVFFAADVKRGKKWYYECERVLQLKSVYQKGVLADLVKLSKENANTFLHDGRFTPSTIITGKKFTVTNPGQNHGLFSADDVAKIFSVTVDVVYKWTQRGQLRWDKYDHANKLLFKAEDIEAFARRRNKGGLIMGINLEAHGYKDVEAALPDVSTAPETVDVDKKTTPAEADAENQNVINNSGVDSITNADEKQNRIAEAERFFNQLFGGVRAQAFSYLWTKQDKATYPFDVSTADNRAKMAIKTIELSDAGFDIYVGVNLTNEAPAGNERAKTEHVTMQTATVADIDVEGGNHISTDKKKYPPLFDVAKTFLPFDVSLLVDSGYGLHGYCVYMEPITITDENRDACIERNKKFISAIRHAAGEYSGAVDGVGDLPRVLRVPGTYNYKCGRDNAPLCRLVEANNIQFTPADIDARLNALEPAQSKPEPTTETSARRPVVDYAEDSPEYKRFRIEHMLRYINVAKGEYEKWLDVGFGLYNEGMELADWEQWSRTQPEFKEGECESKWQGFHNEPRGITFATLHMWAIEGGYDERATQREWYQLHPELSRTSRVISGRAGEKILDNINAAQPQQNSLDAITDADLRAKLEAWQEVHGAINPDVVPELEVAAQFVSSLTVETFTADITTKPTRLKQLALLKFYVPGYYANFGTILRGTKEFAKSILKEITRERESLSDPPAVDTTEISKLAALVPSKIDADIERLVTDIRREQSNYITRITHERQELERRSRLEAYYANAPTTRKRIADCPIDLIIPEEIYFGEKEIGLNALRNDRPITLPAAKSPIVPTRIFREPRSHTTSYEVAIKSKRKWKKVVVDGDVLFDSRKVISLAKDGGALIKDANKLTKFFAEIIKANEDALPFVKTYSQPGWYGGHGEPLSFVYPTGGENYIVRRAGFDYEAAFSSRGSADVWKKFFVEACAQGGSIARIFIGTALAAPLVAHLDVMNMQLHLSAPNDAGKTGLLKLTASIFGNPKELLKSFAATPKNRLFVAGACNDLPSFLDEMETMTGKQFKENLSTMIYEFAQGVGNQAQKRNGVARETFKFNGSRVSAAERRELKNNDQRGAFKRLLQIDTRDKIFDANLAADLHAVTAKHFGLFGRTWTEFIATNLHAISEHFDKLAKFFLGASEYEPTHIKSIVAAAIAIQYFMVCIGAQSSFDDKKCEDDICAIVDKQPKRRDMDDAVRAIGDLSSFVAGHVKYFSLEKTDAGDDLQQWANESYGKTFRNGSIAILPHALREILEDKLHYASCDQLVDEFNSRGLLITDTGRRTHKAFVDGRRQRTYHFKAGVLSTDKDTDEENYYDELGVTD